MPVTGGGGDAANVTLKARIVAGEPPSASQIKGPTIQKYDQEGFIAPYNILEDETFNYRNYWF